MNNMTNIWQVFVDGPKGFEPLFVDHHPRTESFLIGSRTGRAKCIRPRAGRYGSRDGRSFVRRLASLVDANSDIRVVVGGPFRCRPGSVGSCRRPRRRQTSQTDARNYRHGRTPGHCPAREGGVAFDTTSIEIFFSFVFRILHGVRWPTRLVRQLKIC